MNKPKYTPGPWTYSVPQSKLDIRNFPFITVMNHEGGTRKGFKAICHIDYPKETQYKKANARLIAAAPEMLEVLIETVKDYKKMGWGCNEERMSGWIKVIEKAGLKVEDILN